MVTQLVRFGSMSNQLVAQQRDGKSLRPLFPGAYILDGQGVALYVAERYRVSGVLHQSAKFWFPTL
jgi:hypothetical protein